MIQEYQTIVKKIKADQFLLDKRHPLLGGEKLIHLPEGVEIHKGCGYRMCDICGGGNSDEKYYHIKGLQINNGYYVIYKEDGGFEILPEKQFKEKYELCKY